MRYPAIDQKGTLSFSKTIKLGPGTVVSVPAKPKPSTEFVTDQTGTIAKGYDY